MSEPQRYWMYLSAPAGGLAQMIADDTGDWVNHRDYVKLQAEHDRLRKIVEREDGEMVYYKDYAKLQAENERLKNAGDAFIGTYLFATAKGLVNQDTAVKVVEEWVAAKTGKTP